MSFEEITTETWWFACSLGLADLDLCSEMEVPTRSQSAPVSLRGGVWNMSVHRQGLLEEKPRLLFWIVGPRRTRRHTVRFSVASFRPLDINSRHADRVQRVSETFFLRISVNVLQHLKCSQWFFRSTSVSCFPPLFSPRRIRNVPSEHGRCWYARSPLETYR